MASCSLQDQQRRRVLPDNLYFMAVIFEQITQCHTNMNAIAKLLEWRTGSDWKKQNVTLFRHGRNWGNKWMEELIRCITSDNKIQMIQQRRTKKEKKTTALLKW